MAVSVSRLLEGNNTASFKGFREPINLRNQDPCSNLGNQDPCSLDSQVSASAWFGPRILLESLSLFDRRYVAPLPILRTENQVARRLLRNDTPEIHCRSGACNRVNPFGILVKSLRCFGSLARGSKVLLFQRSRAMRNAWLRSAGVLIGALMLLQGDAKAALISLQDDVAIYSRLSANRLPLSNIVDGNTDQIRRLVRR